MLLANINLVLERLQMPSEAETTCGIGRTCCALTLPKATPLMCQKWYTLCRLWFILNFMTHWILCVTGTKGL